MGNRIQVGGKQEVVAGERMTDTSDREISPERTVLSFRRRLLRKTTPAILLSLALLCVFVWLAVYIAFSVTEQRLLRSEIEEVTSMVGFGGEYLRPDRYEWNEPHHLSISIGRNPLFVQVFDTSGNLLQQSENVTILTRLTTFPDSLLMRPASGERRRIRPNSVISSGRRYNWTVGRVEKTGGDLLGYVQVVKYAPDNRMYLVYWGLLLGVIFIIFSSLILGTIAWSADQALIPLRAITQYARDVSAEDLDTPVQIPDDADMESVVLANALNDLTNRLKELIDGVRQFTADAAHEMITPLTILRGHIEVALRRPRTDVSYEQTLRFLESRLDQMIRMVRGLIMLARMDESSHIVREAVDVGMIAVAIHTELVSVAKDKNLDISVSTDDNSMANSQTDLVYEAAYNLVENAIKYTDSGWVKISVERRPETVLFIVEDSGPGLTAEEQRLIWRRFYRTPGATTQRVEGSGLGMALTQKIVSGLDGHVDVVSKRGEGSRFIISLPAWKELNDD
jgi:signal transduction histidine kinase